MEILLPTKENQTDPNIKQSLKFILLSEEIDKQNERYDKRQTQEDQTY